MAVGVGNCLVLELYVVECFEVLMVEVVVDCLVLEFFFWYWSYILCNGLKYQW